MTDAEQLAQVEALIAQFKKLKLRELYLRWDDLEVHLSTENDVASLKAIRAGSIPAAPDSASSNPARALPESTSAAASMSAPPLAPAAAATATPATAGAEAGDLDPARLPPGHVLVRAPYMGTFYRSPKPGSPPFVEVGSPVEPGSDLCLVEVMKLFTTLRAPARGHVQAVLVADGSLVAAEQPLFVLVHT